MMEHELTLEERVKILEDLAKPFMQFLENAKNDSTLRQALSMFGIRFP